MKKPNVYSRRKVLLMPLGLSLLSHGMAHAAPKQGAAEAFPSKFITLTVSFRAGVTTDVTARALARAAGDILGQSIVIMNNPVGSGTAALTTLAHSAPDGYNLAVLGSTQVRNQYMQKDYPISVLNDFTPIAHYMMYQFGILVRADAKWQTFQEFMTFAKQNPGKISIGISAFGTPQHFTLERLAWAEKIKWESVPFNGSPNAALLGGHIDAIAGNPDWVPYVESGQFRLLAVSGSTRMAKFPSAPSLKELGYDINEPGFNAIVGPKGMDPAVVHKIAEAFRKVVQDPNSEFSVLMKRYDLPISWMGPDEFGAYLRAFDASAQEVIRRAGLWKKD